MNLDYGYNWRGLKARLTRAERSKDPERARATVAEARRIFDAHGWPDWWSRVDRLEWDAEGWARDVALGRAPV